MKSEVGAGTKAEVSLARSMQGNPTAIQVSGDKAAAAKNGAAPRNPGTAILVDDDAQATSQIGQPERVVQFAIGKKASIGSDAAAVALQLQLAVEIGPWGAVIRFTNWMFHLRAPLLTTTR